MTDTTDTATSIERRIMICAGAKGGQGTTTIAAALALVSARHGHSTLLVDMTGDLAVVLGTIDQEPAGNLAEALTRPTYVADGLRLVHLPLDALDETAIDGLGSLAAAGDRIVIDAGRAGPHLAPFDPLPTQTLLVTRPCYLALHAATHSAYRPDEIVLITEPDRALGARDVAAVLGRPVTGVPFDPAIARVVDAGLFTARLPRSLANAVARLVR